MMEQVTTERTGGWEEHRREGESPMTGSEAKRERMATFLEWLLTPEAEREPRTKRDLAAHLGISETTLYSYTREPSFQKRLASERARLRKVEKAEDVLSALYERAMGDTPQANAAAKIWLQYTLDVDDDLAGDVDLTDLSNDEVMEIALRVLNLFANREGK